MRKVRNITVAVDPDLYRQTRMLAAEYDTTVTDMVRFLLKALPEALEDAHYPRGSTQLGFAVAHAGCATPPAPVSAPPAGPDPSQVGPIPGPTSDAPTQSEKNIILQNSPVPL